MHKFCMKKKQSRWAVACPGPARVILGKFGGGDVMQLVEINNVLFSL